MGTVQIDGSTPKITVGNATAEDATILFDGNAQDFYIALDDSADDLLIGLGSTVGTTPAISIDENLAVKTYGDITMTGTTPVLTIGDAGAEDTAIVFDGNAQDFHIGLDDTADDLVIGVGSTLGTTTAIAIDENANTTFSGTVTIGSTGITNNGITAASQWRLTTGFTGDADPIDSNWEEVDTDGYGTLGSSMTESSGIFSFSSTGYWLITFTLYSSCDDDEDYHGGLLHTSTDGGSNYSQAAGSYNSVSTPTTFSARYQSSTSSFMFDVTNTSNCKVKFSISSQSDNATTNGGSSSNYTCATFVRLGDT
jgi:hypothetical protein